jgi:hypothetical protein
MHHRHQLAFCMTCSFHLKHYQLHMPPPCLLCLFSHHLQPTICCCSLLPCSPLPSLEVPAVPPNHIPQNPNKSLKYLAGRRYQCSPPPIIVVLMFHLVKCDTSPDKVSVGLSGLDSNGLYLQDKFTLFRMFLLFSHSVLDSPPSPGYESSNIAHC